MLLQKLIIPTSLSQYNFLYLEKKISIIFDILGYVSGPQLMSSMQGIPVPMGQGPYGGMQFQGKTRLHRRGQ